jgi:hypothetical protein
MLSEEVFLKGMIMLGAAFPDYQATEQTFEVYREMLKDFDPKDFERVVKNHIAQSRFFPKVCELREELVRLRRFNRPTAVDAWNALYKVLEERRAPKFDESIERALRVIGGWEGFRRMTYKDLRFFWKDFERAYNEEMEREDRKLRIGCDLYQPQAKELPGPEEQAQLASINQDPRGD